MHELSINLHIHTPYSDGNGTHFEIAQAAIKAGLDAVIITDHNVYVRNIEGYQNFEGKSVLVLVGEEIHHQDREPQKNHLLVFDANRAIGDPRELAIGA